MHCRYIYRKLLHLYLVLNNLAGLVVSVSDVNNKFDDGNFLYLLFGYVQLAHWMIDCNASLCIETSANEPPICDEFVEKITLSTII